MLLSLSSQLFRYRRSNTVLHDLVQAKADRIIPKNYNQAVKLANYKAYWLPAMEKQVKAL
ncbi:hypothetical protein NEUTE2DRAFT_130117 [Neurospora tetrasperma FGSC 2509]|nr:hypothetical protein NEUTE2DRAFT_130117 [Neurospora tetrasperma FGSC 2509]